MDIIMVSVGKRELEDALKSLRQARHFIGTGMGGDSSDPLKYPLEATKHGWDGDEIILLDDMIASTTKQIATIDTTQISGEELRSSWGENIPDDVWECVHPIAERIDFSKMLESYNYIHRESVLHKEGDHLSDSIYDYICKGLTDFAKYGINITIPDIIAKCDIEGYSSLSHLDYDKDDMHPSAGPEHWAFHMLTYFLDVPLAYDGWNTHMYDIDSACQKAVEEM